LHKSARKSTRRKLTPGTTFARLRLRPGSVASNLPPSAQCAEVMGATNFSSDLGDEDRAVCRSPRSEGSLSAFHRGGDDDYADREFDFDDLLLSWCSAKTR
jgi:hypothetical protein